jgi:DNA-binding response OmpR family regulator
VTASVVVRALDILTSLVERPGEVVSKSELLTRVWLECLVGTTTYNKIRRLLAAGADKTTKNKHGVSPESLAQSIGNYDTTPFLAG